MKRSAPFGLGVLLALFGVRANAQTQSAPLFPSPLLVEHHAVQSAHGGDDFRTDSVTDYYTGSWIVSTRANGDRTIVDLARRELTEVQTSKGTFWTLTFGRMAELRARLAVADAGEKPARTTSRVSAPQRGRKAAIRVEDVANGTRSYRPVDLQGNPVAGRLSEKPGLRHLRASAEGRAGGVELWVDGRVRLSKEARAALRGFESEALGTPAIPDEVSHAELMSAARDAADGAFSVRTLRTSGTPGTEIEDVVTRLEPVASVPPKLLSIPETFRRVPSPLEAMVAFAEDEAARSSMARKRAAN